jgi:hypothetical protein
MDRIISEQLEGMKQRIEVLPVRLSREHAYNAVRVRGAARAHVLAARVSRSGLPARARAPHRAWGTST